MLSFFEKLLDFLFKILSNKESFIGSKSSEIIKAKEILKDDQDEIEFYDEALRQEVFRDLTGIICCKKNREIYQKLVKDGIASTEGIRQAYLFIHDENSKIIIKFDWMDKIETVSFIITLSFGIICVPIYFFNLAYNFNVYNFPNNLFWLSLTALFILTSVRGLLPALFARAIQSRLKKYEKTQGSLSLPPADQPTPPIKSA